MKKDGWDSTSVDDSGKFLVTLHILDSVMQLTREKIVLVSYSTKVATVVLAIAEETNQSFGW